MRVLEVQLLEIARTLHSHHEIPQVFQVKQGK